jgi:hypothetical protein
MRIRRFFFISLVLAVVALGLHVTAMSQFSGGLGIRGHAVTLPESDRAAARVEASRYSSRGLVIAYIGLPVALASLAFLVVSARRHEPAWRSVTFALLCFYVMLQFDLI